VTDRINLPLLVTSAIKPSASFTALEEPRVRLEATLLALEEWIKMGVSDLVICDGSNFDIESSFLKRFGSSNALRVEFITFNNDAKMVAERGKGYGEGQIVAEALSRSELIKEKGAFAKCTGKFWVKNAREVIKKFNTPFKADVFGVLSIRYVDTRFYLAELDFYDRWLKDSYLNVNDDAGYWIEHAFLERLKESGIKGWISRPAIWTEGLSGTKGLPQNRKLCKEWMRTIRNHGMAAFY